jgi:putative ABC transport system permease protein
MLIANQAVGSKIETVRSSIGNTVTIRPAGFSGASVANNGLSTNQLATVSKLAHITKVVESLNGNMTTVGTTQPDAAGGQQQSGGSTGQTSLKSSIKLGEGSGIVLNTKSLPKDFSPPISIVGTTNPSGTIGDIDAKVTVTKGSAIDGAKDSNDAMISEALAAKNNLHVGSTFTAFNETVTIKALFKTDTQTGDNFVIVSLPAMQRLSGNSNAITNAAATVDSVNNIDSITSVIKKALGDSADITNSKQTVQDAIVPLQSIQSISLYSLIGAVVASGAIILLTMVMIVRERKREIGIIKAIGFSNVRIMLQFMSEALTFALLGTMTGLGLGLLAGGPVTKALVDSNTGSHSSGGHLTVNNTIQGIADVQAHVSWSILAYGLGIAVCIALLGSALASYFIAKVRPAVVLRSE